jgi:predicted metal-dependent peptidase
MATVAPAPEYDYRELDRQLDRVKANVFMRSDAAFFGPMLCSMEFQWTPGLGTAANDGVVLKWDPMDFLRLTDGARKATLVHELWHPARLHMLRRGNRCPKIWNLACDVWINRDLRKNGYELTPKELWFDRPDLDHIEMEEDIYDWLINPGGGGMTPGQVPSGMSCGKCQGATTNLNPTPAQKQQMINAVVKAVNSANMSNQPGAIPGNTSTILSKFLSPVIPWEKHVYQWMNDLLEEDYTWARPCRRNLANGLYLPSRFQDEGRLEHLMFFQDVSGSISDADSLRFNSELKFIWETYKPKMMTIVQFDTIIQKIDVMHEDDPFNEIRITGRGGTCLECVRKHIMDNKPTAAIVFSDLFVEPMLPGPKCPVLWVAINNKAAQVKFGKLIHIKV